jgi:hypothetical protein
MALAAGSRLGPYEIVDRLGSGGMGVVYRARDPRLGRDVALKVLPDDVASDPERLRRFETEARAAGALAHPNVVVVHDIGEAGGTPFVVSELLEGETLRERLRRGALAPGEAVAIALGVAQGLEAAHERGIVHRDIKPENLFLTRLFVGGAGGPPAQDEPSGRHTAQLERSHPGTGHDRLLDGSWVANQIPGRDRMCSTSLSSMPIRERCPMTWGCMVSTKILSALRTCPSWLNGPAKNWGVARHNMS